MNEKFEAKDILLSQFSLSDESLTAKNKSKYKHSCVSLGRYRIAIVNNIKESCFFSNYCAPLNSGSPKESKHQNSFADFCIIINVRCLVVKQINKKLNIIQYVNMLQHNAFNEQCNYVLNLYLDPWCIKYVWNM